MRAYVIAALAALAPGAAYGMVAVDLSRPTLAPPEEKVEKRAPPKPPEAGKEGERPERKLKPLILSPEITLQFSEQAAVPVPSIHAQGNYTNDFAKYVYGVFQFRLDLNPRPGAGDPVAVARRVRVMPGTANLNLGYRLTWAPTVGGGDDGPWGVDVILGGSAAAQTAEVIVASSTPGAPPEVLTGYTSVGSVNAALAIWLGHAYLAAQWTKYWAGGKDQAALAHEINRTENVSVAAIYALQVASERPNEPARPVYLQFGGSGKPDFSDTIWSLKLALTFDPL